MIDLETFKEVITDRIQDLFCEDDDAFELAMEEVANFEKECDWDDYETTEEAIEDAVTFVKVAMELE